MFDGEITLVYESLEELTTRYNEFTNGEDGGGGGMGKKLSVLKGSKFHVDNMEDNGTTEMNRMRVIDPWGNKFKIISSSDPLSDRAAHLGSQPQIEGHSASEGLAMKDLTVYVPHGTNLEGIGRFYEYVLGAPTMESSTDFISIGMSSIIGSGQQTLTFQYHPDGPETQVQHYDFSYDEGKEDNGDSSISTTSIDIESYPSNHGPHISLYITNLRHAYQRASKLGVLYVNPRFKRRAYTEEEAVDQCMFRIINIVDPLDYLDDEDHSDKDREREVILRLEHEVRAVKTREGKKYKSCPLLEIP